MENPLKFRGLPGFAPKKTSIYRSISPICEELPSPLLLLGFSKGGAVGNLSDRSQNSETPILDVQNMGEIDPRILVFNRTS